MLTPEQAPTSDLTTIGNLINGYTNATTGTADTVSPSGAPPFIAERHCMNLPTETIFAILKRYCAVFNTVNGQIQNYKTLFMNTTL